MTYIFRFIIIHERIYFKIKMDQYNISLNELKNLEKEIKDCIRQLKENQEENTVRLELQAKKKLDEYSSKFVKLFNEYQSPKAKGNL